MELWTVHIHKNGEIYSCDFKSKEKAVASYREEQFKSENADAFFVITHVYSVSENGHQIEFITILDN